jgi:hypothetical protein
MHTQDLNLFCSRHHKIVLFAGFAFALFFCCAGFSWPSFCKLVVARFQVSFISIFFLILLWRKCYKEKEKETNSKMTITEGATHGVIFICAGFAIVWAFIQFRIIAQTEVRSVDGADRDNSSLLSKKRPLVEEGEAGGSSSSTGKHLHLPV